MSFFHQFIRHQETVGSIIPSSRFLANKMINQIPHSPVRILEVGAGNGVITHQIVNHCHQDSTIVVSELNPYFCDILHAQFFDHIELIQGDILNYHSDLGFDFIICSLQFNQLPILLIKQILNHFKTLLSTDGTLTFFEYAGMSQIKRKIDFIKFKQESLFPLRVNRQLELRNFPPANIHSIRFCNSLDKVNG